MLSEAGTEADKVQLMKSMGNMGAKELIGPLKAILEDRSRPTTIRIQAVIALRKLAKPFERLVL